MKLIHLLILSFLLLNCAGSKIDKILKQGNVLQQNFKTTIPFTFVNGWIVLEVKIKNKTYNFILDTGSSNLLTKELANELNNEILGNAEISDINNEINNTKYTKIKNIKIGNIDFQETIAGIVDLNKITEIGCAKIDGFIGSNLMRKAVWDFDFQKQLITITNDEKKLEIPKETIETKLFIGTAGIPSVIVTINGQRTLNNIVDLGNAGDNHLRIDYFQKQKKDKRIRKYIKSSGKAWGGFGWTENNISYDVIIDKMQIGNHTVNNLFANVSNVDGNLGLSFFKNYRLILNWQSRRMKMIKIKEKNQDNYKTYGFSVIYNANNLYVNYIIENSSASKYLKHGDRIIRINDLDYSSVSEQEYCNYLANENVNKNVAPISITVLRNDKKLKFQLIKQNYFESAISQTANTHSYNIGE